MSIPNHILHDKQYADKILEITADTMFFVHRDGTCLDFKPNTPDFYIKGEEIIGKNIFSYFPAEASHEMYEEFVKVLSDGKPSARNYKLISGNEVKYYKCIISKYDRDHLIFQYRDITGRSVVRLKLEKKQKDLREICVGFFLSGFTDKCYALALIGYFQSETHTGDSRAYH